MWVSKKKFLFDVCWISDGVFFRARETNGRLYFPNINNTYLRAQYTHRMDDSFTFDVTGLGCLKGQKLCVQVPKDFTVRQVEERIRHDIMKLPVNDSIVLYTLRMFSLDRTWERLHRRNEPIKSYAGRPLGAWKELMDAPCAPAVIRPEEEQPKEEEDDSGSPVSVRAVGLKQLRGVHFDIDLNEGDSCLKLVWAIARNLNVLGQGRVFLYTFITRPSRSGSWQLVSSSRQDTSIRQMGRSFGFYCLPVGDSQVPPEIEIEADESPPRNRRRSISWRRGVVGDGSPPPPSEEEEADGFYIHFQRLGAGAHREIFDVFAKSGESLYDTLPRLRSQLGGDSLLVLYYPGGQNADGRLIWDLESNPKSVIVSAEKTFGLYYFSDRSEYSVQNLPDRILGPDERIQSPPPPSDPEADGFYIHFEQICVNGHGETVNVFTKSGESLFDILPRLRSQLDRDSSAIAVYSASGQTADGQLIWHHESDPKSAILSGEKTFGFCYHSPDDSPLSVPIRILDSGEQIQSPPPHDGGDDDLTVVMVRGIKDRKQFLRLKVSKDATVRQLQREAGLVLCAPPHRVSIYRGGNVTDNEGKPIWLRLWNDVDVLAVKDCELGFLCQKNHPDETIPRVQTVTVTFLPIIDDASTYFVDHLMPRNATVGQARFWIKKRYPQRHPGVKRRVRLFWPRLSSEKTLTWKPLNDHEQRLLHPSHQQEDNCFQRKVFGYMREYKNVTYPATFPCDGLADKLAAVKKQEATLTDRWFEDALGVKRQEEGDTTFDWMPKETTTKTETPAKWLQDCPQKPQGFNEFLGKRTRLSIAVIPFTFWKDNKPELGTRRLGIARLPKDSQTVMACKQCIAGQAGVLVSNMRLWWATRLMSTKDRLVWRQAAGDDQELAGHDVAMICAQMNAGAVPDLESSAVIVQRIDGESYRNEKGKMVEVEYLRPMDSVLARICTCSKCRAKIVAPKQSHHHHHQDTTFLDDVLIRMNRNRFQWLDSVPERKWRTFLFDCRADISVLLGEVENDAAKKELGLLVSSIVGQTLTHNEVVLAIEEITCKPMAFLWDDKDRRDTVFTTKRKIAKLEEELQMQVIQNSMHDVLRNELAVLRKAQELGKGKSKKILRNLKQTRADLKKSRKCVDRLRKWKREAVAKTAELSRAKKGLKRKADEMEQKGADTQERLVAANKELERLKGRVVLFTDEVIDKRPDEELSELQDRLERALKRIRETRIGKRIRRDAEKKHICVVCLDALTETVLQPCNHMCCCKKCSRLVSKCPVCREVVNGKLDVFA